MEGRSEVGRRQRQVSGSTRNVVVGCAISGLWKGEEGLVLAYQGSERLQDVALGAWVLSKYKLRVRATAQRRQGAGSRSGNQGAVVLVGYVGQWKEQQDNKRWEGALVGTTEGEEEAVIMDDDEEKENRIEVFDLRNCQRSVHPRAKEAGCSDFFLLSTLELVAEGAVPIRLTQPFPNERNISIPYWYYHIIAVAAHSTISAEILQQNEASTQTGRYFNPKAA
ncbi:uncharacterized protein F5891DRAFT_974198 [Suillus fuscotomentosus]|uniref:Uncharacterized protein n=1 Tax=Suillus fuscotomentosus TaxID=1912939 RepID=A0AAD4EMN8_9AGAM|nr:uncharacterized protein F5891DRAFT_974198 [Suillus fuscotomentosus]KAG1908912.1 hypothetical protein F5891DRAFT_974198 [Suillus fuscotomentosus]